jgi:2-amino-4-hydroxy-6-hydroxymethyldihydropteridine diphosphokinase
MTSKAFIAFGSNIGDREAKFLEALESLRELPSTQLVGFSKLYETEPVGISDGGSAFLNGVIELDTNLNHRDLMSVIRDKETALGKSPVHRSDQSRVIDLDLLLYDDLVCKEDEIEIPHPRMHLRAFVLVPLAEIAPEIVHPVFHRTVETLLLELPENLESEHFALV